MYVLSLLCQYFTYFPENHQNSKRIHVFYVFFREEILHDLLVKFTYPVYVKKKNISCKNHLFSRYLLPNCHILASISRGYHYCVAFPDGFILNRGAYDLKS